MNYDRASKRLMSRTEAIFVVDPSLLLSAAKHDANPLAQTYFLRRSQHVLFLYSCPILTIALFIF